uniref:ATP-dependent Clp protease proteolytic subunit 1 n=1 Tax=Lygus hesperus TaxID=30085 RepID=A0A0A9WTS9_LYGHE
MFKSASSYLRQTAPTCRIVSWSLNRAVERAMGHVKLDAEYSAPDFFADTEPNQFAPWPTHEKLAFGGDMIPTLVRLLNVSRREKPVLQLLRSLEHLLSDPEHCTVALRLDVLKALTSLLLQKSSAVKLWVMASLRVIAGNPNGKMEIVKRPIIMSEIIGNFQAPNRDLRQMAYTIMLRLSENWFAVEDLQKQDCIRLVLKSIFTLSSDDVFENRKSLVWLLDTLGNLIDHKIGVLKAIRYDLFELRWLLSCGMRDVEEAILNVFVRVSKDEVGRLGLRYKHVAKTMLSHFYDMVDEGGDPTQVGTMLMFSTLPNNERDDYYNMNTVTAVMEVFKEPTISNVSRLVLLKLLTNLAELPQGRSSIKEHLQFLITVPICDPIVQESVETLIKKVVWIP